MRCDDTVMNHSGDVMQCEETSDWPRVGAELLSLARLTTLPGECTINYVAFRYLIRQELLLINGRLTNKSVRCVDDRREKKGKGGEMAAKSMLQRTTAP